MLSNKVYWILWCIFIGYSVFFAPKNADKSKPTGVLVKQLLFGPWNDIDPYVISLFYLLGIWPLVYACIILADAPNQPFNSNLACLLSMVFGGFVLLPYYALRRNPNPAKYKWNFLVRIFDSKVIYVFLILATISVLLFAAIFGDFHRFMHEFRTNRFIHIMSIDFFVVSWLFPFQISDDLKRRKMINNHEAETYFPFCFLPLFGPLIYLYQRKPLQQIKEQNA